MAILDWVVREVLSKEVTFKQRQEEASPTQGTAFQAKEIARAKSLELTFLLRNGK